VTVTKYRILSIDGGGVRGLLVTVLLQQLDKRLPGWRDRADLLAGTSTGGIVALGLAKGLTPTDLRSLYYDKSARIFGDSLLDNIRDLGRVVGAEFSNRNLRQELEAVFGATRLQNLGKRVLISSFDLDNEDPDPNKRTWKPKFFHNFPGTDTDGSLRVVDVALYTSAAPTYFPSVDGYVDGGVAANNPSMAALAQSLDRRARIPQRPSIDEISLLSMGTGRSLSRITGKRHDWGYAQWAKPLLRLMFDAVSGIPDYQCRQILGDHYHRMDYTFKPGQEVDLAEHAARDRLVKIAEEEMKADIDQAVVWLRKNWM
jgi:patatin-like phospholipase/acyl hydrolase